ncbi:uncharacterized protein BXIN_0957 [Babesia sp. Xinjiang]|uniref:uncharacterized protein n=1 Tax=Babesia sp. Xinjiang TaxID=462227 RepID=UPI000A261F6F|nr:uncharacterized protein BXIN_0957 [Babesia sp. Xinjiang]ORM42079.1 hypothetical protein BXIN_0957 [Babesia sp. Xinjiang]
MAKPSAGVQQYTELAHPPGSLKECIDWILRVTEKDGKNGGGNGDGSTQIGEKVVELLQKAEDYLTQEINKHNGDAEATTKLKKDKAVLETVTTSLKNGSGSNLITKLADELKKFIGWQENGNGQPDGNGIAQSGYESSYGQEANWNNASTENDQQLCASIFLGALPLIFSGLSYLYWQCNESEGIDSEDSGSEQLTRWSNATQITNTNAGIGIYFASCGYKSVDLQNGKTANEIKNLIDQQFNNSAKVSHAYPVYINAVLENTRKNASGNATSYPLTSLYICSTYYFQSQFQNGTHVPTTIREMLYWLMALPYSECFQLAPEAIKKTINDITKNNSGSDSIPFDVGPTLNHTDPFDCYMSTTCHYAAVVLSTMQGTICDTTPGNPPNIHTIYDNSHFKFNYPKNPSDWFNKLWDVVYHLITQLYFLKEQCRTCFGAGCGWQWCQYGDGINSHMTKEVESWICTVTPGETHSSGSGGNHTSGCTESQQHIAACGKDNNPSPLQAFLCDLLIPFKCPKFVENKKYPPYTEHISHRNFNQYCPVPMGFNKDYLPSSPRTGHYIYEILNYFTQNKNHHISLYNIFICLICTGLRTPRTVGDLFGFFLYLGEKMNNGGSPKVADAIDTESKKIPWSNQSTPMTTAAHDLAGKTHIDDPSHHPADADLYTLHDSECAMSVTCGKYLDPLSFVIYCNVSVAFAETYLSRIIYLTHALKEGLKVLLTEFNNLTCEHCQSCDCKGKHTNNQHTTSCLCTTIVQCADVLPLFFKFGFTYYYAAALNGTEEFDSSKKRQCKDFAKQLQNVIINGGLFKKLLEEINKFLLCIRKPFLLYLLTFWLVAILYFSYGLTIPLDLFHIRSHWRRALSHQISVLALLSKKAMSPTKVGYFTP